MSSLKEHKFVYFNGIFDAKASERWPLPPGTVLNVEQGFELRLPDKVVPEDAVHLVFSGAEHSPRFEREFSVKIFAGVSTRLNFILHKTGNAEFIPARLHVEFFLSENACVDYYQVEESDVCGEFSTENIFHLKKHASLDYLAFAAAAGVSKSRTTVDFQEEHGFFSAKGLSMLKDRSRAEHVLLVHHRAPHCISRQYYKSVLAGESKSDFNSLVYVHANAFKSDSQQLNRNLLLSEEAQASSKPELRIDNDDVAASHGSASGQLNDDELFYLQSRGFSKDRARLVLVDGFAEEIVGEIHEKNLKAHLEKAIHGRIEAMMGGKKS